MGMRDEGALQPFLNGHDHEPRDASLELPELHHRIIHDDDNDTVESTLLSSPPSLSGSPSLQFQSAEDKHVLDNPPPPKRPAAYAIVFMLGAQVFSASMNVSIRLLENTSTQLHPLQVRMLSFALLLRNVGGVSVCLWGGADFSALDPLRPDERHHAWHHRLAMETEQA